MTLHLGVRVRPGKRGLKLTREQYALINKRNSLRKFASMKDAYEDEEGKYYTDEWCKKHRENCLKNFDLHMELFQQLDHAAFEYEIQLFVQRCPMCQQVKNLNEHTHAGYYIMVLDDYCQLYVGTRKI